jgi:hypothetical protein
MTSTGKVIVGIIAVLIIAAAGYYWYASTSSPSTGTALGVPAPTGTLPNNGTGSATNGRPEANTSDAGLAQDAASIDAQMSGLVSDTSRMNSSVGSKP